MWRFAFNSMPAAPATRGLSTTRRRRVCGSFHYPGEIGPNGDPRSLTKPNSEGVALRWSRGRARSSSPQVEVLFLTRQTVEDGGAETDPIRSEVAQFRRLPPVPEGNQGHGSVPMLCRLYARGADFLAADGKSRRFHRCPVQTMVCNEGRHRRPPRRESE
jgi:hypothetical protein